MFLVFNKVFENSRGEASFPVSALSCKHRFLSSTDLRFKRQEHIIKFPKSLLILELFAFPLDKDYFSWLAPHGRGETAGFGRQPWDALFGRGYEPVAWAAGGEARHLEQQENLSIPSPEDLWQDPKPEVSKMQKKKKISCVKIKNVRRKWLLSWKCFWSLQTTVWQRIIDMKWIFFDILQKGKQ